MLDVGSLIAPLSEDQPAGPDLYGDGDRQAIEAAFERSVSDGGGVSTDATEWRRTIDLILTQSERTRDLWLPVYLMRAAALAGDFELLVDGAEVLARLLEERWDDVHPQLDEVGFIGRKTPCEALTRIGDFLNPVLQVPLLIHPRLGKYSGQDFDRFREQGAKAEQFGMFRALIEGTPPGELQQVIDRIDALDVAIRRADAVLTANANGDTATNFQPTYDCVERIRRAVKAAVPGGAEENEMQPETSVTGGSSQTARADYSGTIASRGDVVQAIDAICAYYAHHEPTSPVPFALRRAKEWISLDFMAVLEDIAPGGLDDAARVLKSARFGSAELPDTYSSVATEAGASPVSEAGSWG